MDCVCARMWGGRGGYTKENMRKSPARTLMKILYSLHSLVSSSSSQLQIVDSKNSLTNPLEM